MARSAPSQHQTCTENKEIQSEKKKEKENGKHE
jgi:hypothetical protein